MLFYWFSKRLAFAGEVKAKSSNSSVSGLYADKHPNINIGNNKTSFKVKEPSIKS